MKKNTSKKKGFTLIELLVIIAIIALLAGVILVSIVKARTKSQATSVFSSIRTAAGPAYSCLTGGLSGARLANMNDSSPSLCLYNSGGTYAFDSSYPDWVDVNKYGWSGELVTDGVVNKDGFYWCKLGEENSTHPTSVGSDYSESGNYGGSASAGEFCYMLKNGDLYMWCTQDGCRKQGF